jgi:glycerate 2-kinase
MIFKNREELIQNGQTKNIKKARQDILEIFSYALDAVNPYNCVKARFSKNQLNIDFKKKIKLSNFQDIYLIAFGKASVGMAQAVCDSINIKEGAVITNISSKIVKSNVIKTYYGSHPIPSDININATERLFELVKKCKENDILFVLISGGGSSLLCKPRVKIEDMQETTDLLIKNGLNIKEINTIRKHISLVKGGQLIKNVKCKVISLIISDVINDPIEFIASGPTAPDSTTYFDCENILKQYKIWDLIPKSVKDIIKKGKHGIIEETPKKDNLIFKKVSNFIVANNEMACNYAKIKSEELNYKTLILTTKLDGEAKEVGKYLIDKADSYLASAEKTAFISSGETTVTITGNGKGGRNQEMVLSALKNLSNTDLVFASFGTDGIDGTSDAAGAIADPFSMKRAIDRGVDYSFFLANNDSHHFFKKLKDQLITGPTGNNVMDIQIILKMGKYY